MLPIVAHLVRDADVGAYAWSALRIFRNVEHTAAAIVAAHALGPDQKANAAKQARQIRSCLIQAEEYARAAQTVTSATRPTLQYYSILSLVTAELLFRGSGEVSLDRARDHHDHHGLTLKAAKKVKTPLAPTDLVARPAVFSAERKGTFELWHREARADAMCGPGSDTLESGGIIQNAMRLQLLPPDAPLAEVPDEGIDLLLCFQHIPALERHLSHFGVNPAFARVSIETKHNRASKEHTTLVTVHHGASDVLDKIYERIRASKPEFQTTIDYPVGKAYKFTGSTKEPWNLHLPNGVSFADHTYIWPYDDHETILNYFGWLYVASFILGSYARYFPEKWMKDIEDSTYLAAAADSFYSVAAIDAPLATLGVLSRACYIR